MTQLAEANFTVIDATSDKWCGNSESQILRVLHDRIRSFNPHVLNSSTISSFLIVDSSSEIAGGCYADLSQERLEGNGSARIAYLAIAEHYEGQGYGRALTGHVESAAHDRQFSSITVSPLRESRGFWLKSGYTPGNSYYLAKDLV